MPTSSRRSINPPEVFDSVQYGFSQAVRVEGGTRVHLSGQVGVDRDERTVGDSLAAQTTQALDNIETVLAAAGGRMRDVVMLRILIVDGAGDLAPISAALRKRFPIDPPASTWLVVSGLAAPGWLIEIEAEAVMPST